MSPKHKLITAVWCSVTMIATLALSHGHLIVREILNHWPASDSWEGRLESALYTQGGLVFVAGLLIVVQFWFAVTLSGNRKNRTSGKSSLSVNGMNGRRLCAMTT